MKIYKAIKRQWCKTFRQSEDETIKVIIEESKKTRKRVDEVERKLSAEISAFMKGNT